MKPSRFIDEIPDEAAEKHFRREHYRMGERREPFANFGGYEGRMEYGYSHSDSYGGSYGGAYGRKGYGGDIYRNDPYSGMSRSTEEKAYNAYNSFDNERVGRFGSLDPTPAGRRKKSSASGLASISGISKGNVKQKPEYGVGDRVQHVKFGIGTVAEIADEPKDYRITVDFDEMGRKVMYAGFAKLKKL